MAVSQGEHQLQVVSMSEGKGKYKHQLILIYGCDLTVQIVNHIAFNTYLEEMLAMYC